MNSPDAQTPTPSPTSAPLPRVLITGAAGRIGSSFAEYAAARYGLRLMVMPGDATAEKIRGFGEVVEADLDDHNALAHAMAGVDACVHLAGEPNASATWTHLLETNIVGTYNLFVAAKAAGCRRVIFASSIHAVSGYPTDVQVKPDEPVNPGDLYGVSKCFGEALGRYMAEKEGVSVVAIYVVMMASVVATIRANNRLAERRAHEVLMDAWVSPRDLNQLIARSIDAVDVRFAIVHGLSNNRFKRLDISNARDLLGYAPEDDSAVTNERLNPLRLRDVAMSHSGISDAQDPQAASGLREQLPPGPKNTAK